MAAEAHTYVYMVERNMMVNQDTKMVLRTVYLPPDLDDQLRVRAFRLKKTKNDLIRDAVESWLARASTDVAPTIAKTKLRTSSRSKTRVSAAVKTQP